ncbi:hypothetical protein BX616_002406 [Lobosporangium transversale]|uniref:Uncharacterized protein n=1 Tax=Lobosporangium transversale TaxID=64571 RepID=A0A1Y2GZQ0_9FUNG|nr:hypothetical protein BCR41DRAFT_367633 [Lobosporangium transversale]KAF9919058.1 hypothetical protein BX616_002406 [Lobosporangium transversale]ORZ27264.1 hypothetical protein BCR41DRAFT_367633 [Lobosporangium transversale]|eukprot:XP_021884991.1 hypothetical protein BCR41DRAFT_367633 [Lobosporangium transversale]
MVRLRSIYTGSLALAGLVFTGCAAVVAYGLPQQLVMDSRLSDPWMPSPASSFPTKGASRIAVSELAYGNEARDLLVEKAHSLNRPYPDGWERILHPPNTFGNTGIQIVDPNNLVEVINAWGLPESIRDIAYNDIRTLVLIAVRQGVYVIQSFSYGVPNCGAGPQPFCMVTLAVVVRARLDQGGLLANPAEIGHIFMQSGAESIQQYRYWEECHRCWLRRCCHNKSAPRALEQYEIDQGMAVLSASQSRWAIENMPAPASFNAKSVRIMTVPQYDVVYSSPAPIPYSPSAMMNSKTTMTSNMWPMFIDDLLRRFLRNKNENKEVFKAHRDKLLNELQTLAKSHHQFIRQFSLTIDEQDAEDLFGNLLSDCFDRANAEETVTEWWRRVRQENPGDIPISLECESTSQKRKTFDPPPSQCKTSVEVTSESSYSWLVISPHGNNLDCLLLQGDIVLSYLECEPLDDDDDDSTDPDVHKGTFLARDHHNCESSRRYQHASSDEVNETWEGSVIRSAIILEDGSFASVRYLVEWKDYPAYVSKALLDILRFSAARSYLRTPLFQSQRPNEIFKSLDNIQAVDPTLVAIGQSMEAVAKGWSAIANAFKNSVTKTIKLKVCLGFEQYQHTAKTLVAQGVYGPRFPEFIGEIMANTELPDRRDLKTIMMGIKYSTNITWVGESMSYADSNGHFNFLFLAKHANAVTKDIDVVYSWLKSESILAKDMLIVRTKRSTLGGLFERDETRIEYIPHVLSQQDAMLLQMFFEVIAFRQIAIATGLTPPDYPKLDSLCDRTTE